MKKIECKNINKKDIEIKKVSASDYDKELSEKDQMALDVSKDFTQLLEIGKKNKYYAIIGSESSYTKLEERDKRQLLLDIIKETNLECKSLSDVLQSYDLSSKDCFKSQKVLINMLDVLGIDLKIIDTECKEILERSLELHIPKDYDTEKLYEFEEKASDCCFIEMCLIKGVVSQKISDYSVMSSIDEFIVRKNDLLTKFADYKQMGRIKEFINLKYELVVLLIIGIRLCKFSKQRTETEIELIKSDIKGLIFLMKSLRSEEELLSVFVE